MATGIRDLSEHFDDYRFGRADAVNAVSSVFLDTSGLIAVANTDDEWHSSVLPVWQSLIAGDSELITTSLVLIELGDGLSRIHLRRLAVELYDRIRTSAEVHVVQVTAEIETLAWQMFRQIQIRNGV